VNTTFVCFLALVSAAPAELPFSDQSAITDNHAEVIRAQSPAYAPLYDPSWDYEPIYAPFGAAPPAYSPPPMMAAGGAPYGGYPAYGGGYAPYGGGTPAYGVDYVMPALSAPTSPAPMATPAPAPMMSPAPYSASPPLYDPILGSTGLVDPSIVGDSGGFAAYGTNGPQPYRYGWMSRYEVGFLPKVSTSNGLGNFGVFEVDTEWQYTTPMTPSPKIFTFTQEFSYRGWDGPASAPGLGTALPGDVYHFGFNMAVATPQMGPYTAKVVVNPSINSDFEDNLTSKAWNIDGHGMVFFRPDPYWTYVIGAGYWDRVNDKVIPYAGFIWTPDDRWEWRLVFPDPRISYFMGNEWGCGCWMYVRAEYHIEAYEIQLETTGAREQVEVEDWRALIGVRKDNGWAGMFFEAGWVFGRNVAFLNGTPGFDPTTGFITRLGVHF